MKRILTVPLSYFLYLLLMGFSLLPLPLLYLFSDGFALILYYVIGYRKKVVMKNLEQSLPPDTDIKKIARQFYRYLGEMFIESIKCFTIGKKNLIRRISCNNAYIMEKYADEGRSVILMSGHYGNWEFLIYSMSILFPRHLAVGVGKPLTNKVLNRLINARRSRFGMKIIHAGNIRESFREDKDILTASLFLSDQYPGHGKSGYETMFLGKATGFMYGAEKYAKDYDFPVVFAALERVRRGRYNIRLEVLHDSPSTSAYGDIMGKYIRSLEQVILKDPAWWLWSHKRWKQLKGFYD